MEKESVQILEVPFNSLDKYQLSLRKEGNDLFLYVNGAPERILERSKNKEQWKAELERLTQKGLRVIGVGYKKIPISKKDQFKHSPQKIKEQAKDFVFAGLLACMAQIVLIWDLQQLRCLSLLLMLPGY